MLTRRSLLAQSVGAGISLTLPSIARPASVPPINVTFLVINDVHACRFGDGLSPNCQSEGKTDANLRRHIAAINRLPELRWPALIGLAPPESVPA